MGSGGGVERLLGGGGVLEGDFSSTEILPGDVISVLSSRLC